MEVHPLLGQLDCLLAGEEGKGAQVSKNEEEGGEMMRNEE